MIFKRNNLKILITGSAGFIGYHLTKRMIAEGFDVHITVNNDTFIRKGA